MILLRCLRCFKQTLPSEKLQRCLRCGENEFFAENFLPSSFESVNFNHEPINSFEEVSNQMIDNSHDPHIQKEFEVIDITHSPDSSECDSEELHNKYQEDNDSKISNICHEPEKQLPDSKKNSLVNKKLLKDASDYSLQGKKELSEPSIKARLINLDYEYTKPIASESDLNLDEIYSMQERKHFLSCYPYLVYFLKQYGKEDIEMLL
ncbi:hypothetical protein HNY73_011021 [Argiope bruennichi]|uniref:Uncharacterized protein n=1 Tax=Argiope bruennichi TaxID=94029 RepID=A0A8T0F2W9_ARGBR|nr:hypothetical protein HNY73_011021 [Argiope bruennichi]